MEGVESAKSENVSAPGGQDGAGEVNQASAFDSALAAAGEDRMPASHRNPQAAADVKEPGLVESLIPVWGSGRQAIHDFQNGRWGWGLFNSAMAISDVFLVKAGLIAAGKAGIAGIARLGGREGIETAASEVAEQIGRTSADNVVFSAATNAAAKLTGQVAYGATDLSQAAMAYRVANDIRTARNVAVFEYVENGVTKTLAMASERGVGHAERLIARELEAMGVDPASVTRIYSELEPCTVLFGGGCSRFINDTFTNAVVTYSFEYGATAQSRNLGVEQLRTAVDRLFAAE